jgi:hypothetical protein
VFLLLHWFLQAEDISTVIGYEKADMSVKCVVTICISLIKKPLDMSELSVVLNVSSQTGKV